MSSRVSPWFLVLVVVTVAGGALTVLGTPARLVSDTSVLLTAGVVLLVLGGWAVSLCLHEFGHAAVAYRGGDTSVADKGYLTLDIRRYTDLTLSFVLPILFLLAGGVPLPGGAVWINEWAIRSRVARSLVSLAGPLINLLLGVALTVVAATVAMPPGLLIGLSYLALVQVLAFLLNILPVPGLDGFGVLEPFLSDQSRQLAAKVRPWAPLVLFLLIISVDTIGQALFAAAATTFMFLGGDAAAASAGYAAFQFWRN